MSWRKSGLRLSDLARGGLLRQALPQVRAPAGDLPRLRPPGPAELSHGHAGVDQGKAHDAHPAPGGTGQGGRRRSHRCFFPEHHLSHAARAFYPSPFPEAAILTVDGVGEWATSTIGFGRGHELTILRELHFPHSLGLLYSAFTYYTGFKVNSGEYKLMGLAPYGNPDAEQTQRFTSADPGRTGGPQGRRVAPPEHGLFRLRHRAHHVPGRQVGIPVRPAAPAPGEACWTSGT